MNAKALYMLEFKHRHPGKKREAKTVVKSKYKEKRENTEVVRPMEEQVFPNQYWQDGLWHPIPFNGLYGLHERWGGKL